MRKIAASIAILVFIFTLGITLVEAKPTGEACMDYCLKLHSGDLDSYLECTRDCYPLPTPDTPA